MSQRRQTKNPSNNNNNNRPPNGVCRDFWYRGSCRFSEGCKFRHERPGLGQSTPVGGGGDPAGAAALRQSGGIQSRAAANADTTMASSGPLNAGQVNAYLNKFCSPAWAFKGVGQARLMLDVLAAVASDSSLLVQLLSLEFIKYADHLLPVLRGSPDGT